MQQQMFIADLDVIDYYCYFKGKYVLIKVKRESLFIVIMLEKLIDFWECVQLQTPPGD